VPAASAPNDDENTPPRQEPGAFAAHASDKSVSQKRDVDVGRQGYTDAPSYQLGETNMQKLCIFCNRLIKNIEKTK
jgi:hypothetical protein